MPAVLSGVDRRTRLGTLILDVLVTEEIDLPSEVSRYPVEDGVIISDHITLGNETLRIAGTIALADAAALESSDAGIARTRSRAEDLLARSRQPGLSADQMDALSTEMDQTRNQLERQGEAQQAMGTKLVDVVEALRTLHRDRALVTVSTGQMTYEGMAFAGLTATRTAGAEGGNWLSIRADLVKINKAELRTAEVPDRAQGPAAGRAGQTNTPAGRAGPGATATTGGAAPRNQTPARGLLGQEAREGFRQRVGENLSSLRGLGQALGVAAP